MNVGIFVNHSKDPECKLANGLGELFGEYGIQTKIYAAKISDSKLETDFCDNLDMMAVLGGDGTILHAVREVAHCGIPILGINIGHLGFLTEIDYDKVKDVIVNLKNEDYDREDRFLLHANIDGRRENIAVNDVCVLGKGVGKMTKISVFVNGKHVNDYKGDGVVVASPTGSTGYSLSAGGPIASPEAECILVTPISAHSLTAKPLVLSAEDVVEVRLMKEDACVAMVDGQERFDIRSSVTIQKNDYKAHFIRFKTYDFYEVLSAKFDNK